jgi:hypothetical protein
MHLRSCVSFVVVRTGSREYVEGVLDQARIEAISVGRYHDLGRKLCQGLDGPGPGFEVGVGDVADPVTVQNHAAAEKQSARRKIDCQFVRSLGGAWVDHLKFLAAKAEDQSFLCREHVIRRKVLDRSVCRVNRACGVADHAKEMLACLFTSLLQKTDRQVGAVDGNAGFTESRITAQVVHMVAVVDGDHPTFAEMRAHPAEHQTRSLGGIRGSDENEGPIRHLDQQRIGVPRKRMCDDIGTAADLTEGKPLAQSDRLRRRQYWHIGGPRGSLTGTAQSRQVRS